MRGMASSTKMKCPNCGAKSDSAATRCRICATDIRPGAEQPLTRPEPGATQFRSARLSGILLIALGGIIVLLIIALLTGAVEGPRWLTNAINKVPFISQQADDGWTTFEEPGARWSAEMPVDRVQGTGPFPGTVSGSADQWLSVLGGTSTIPDTELIIIWTTVAFPPGENINASLSTTAEQWGNQLGGKVTRNDEATFRGLPARRVTITGLEQGKDDATIEALMTRRRDQLIVVVSRSVYADHPQFARLVDNFNFL